MLSGKLRDLLRPFCADVASFKTWYSIQWRSVPLVPCNLAYRRILGLPLEFPGRTP